MGKVVTAATIRRKARARLLAAEWVRNGQDFAKAWRTITGSNATPNMGQLGEDMPEFLSEIERAIRSADVDKELILSMIYAQASMSPLDFMDDEGNELTIADLKKLPRHLQAAIEEISITTTESEIRDENDALVLDDAGRPRTTTKRKVWIKIVDKQKAQKLLADIMRWVGPKSVTINANTVNFANIQQQAERRQGRMTIEGARSAIVVDDPE